MTRNAETSEANLLDAIVSRYQSEGFDTFVHPSKSVLPGFMGDMRPDAIAIGPTQKIAIEIIRANGPHSNKVEQLRQLFANQSDWELMVFYVSQSSSTSDIAAPNLDSITTSISEINELQDRGHALAALIMGWSILEGIARALLGDQLERPQPAAQLLEVLASQGFFTPSEADRLRPLAELRNKVAHGGLDVRIDSGQLDALLSAIHRLAKRLRKT